jgi:hypothetical protein
MQARQKQAITGPFNSIYHTCLHVGAADGHAEPPAKGKKKEGGQAAKKPRTSPAQAPAPAPAQPSKQAAAIVIDSDDEVSQGQG